MTARREAHSLAATAAQREAKELQAQLDAATAQLQASASERAAELAKLQRGAGAAAALEVPPAGP
jgi:hypothetical protein